MPKRLDLDELGASRAARLLKQRAYAAARKGKVVAKTAVIGKPLKPCVPATDLAFRLQQRDSFKEADALAQRFGLTYLSITGTAKLVDIIAHVRGEKEK